jgi:hypothetical protein
MPDLAKLVEIWMIKVISSGSWRNTYDFLHRMQSRQYLQATKKYGPQGVAALRAATPKERKDGAESWFYEIVERPGYFSIQWLNTDTVEPGHIPVAVLIQYGHGTRGGGFVQGRDYINPAMRPIFDQIAADMWKEVTK